MQVKTGVASPMSLLYGPVGLREGYGAHDTCVSVSLALETIRIFFTNKGVS